VLGYLDVHSLAQYGQVNVQAKKNNEDIKYLRARALGYESSNRNGAGVYLKELFNEVRLLCGGLDDSYCEDHSLNIPLIPKKYISYKKNKKNDVNYEQTLGNLVSLTDLELFHIFGDNFKMHCFSGGYDNADESSTSSDKIKFYNCLSKIKNKSNNRHDEKTKAIGSEALRLAVKFNETNIVKLLLEHNADANCPCSTNNPYDRSIPKTNFPIHLASTGYYNESTPKVKIVKLLLDHGVNINVRDADGKTALTLAKESGMQEVAELLSQRGAME